MASATADRKIRQKVSEGNPVDVVFPVSTTAVLYKGTFVCGDSGYASDGADTIGFKSLGIAAQAATGHATTDGGIPAEGGTVGVPSGIKVHTTGVFSVASTGIAQTDLPAVVTLADNQTVQAVGAGNDVLCGVAIQMDTQAGANNVWVDIGRRAI